jgi:hypothetical protein
MPGEGDQTEGQEQVRAPKEMTGQQVGDVEDEVPRFTLIVSQLAGRSSELHRQTEYRRSVIICYASLPPKKKAFIREKQSEVAASVVLQRYLRGHSIEIRPLLHLQVHELSSCGPLSIQQHDHNSSR